MKISKYIAMLGLLLIVSGSYGQDVVFTASARETVSVGEQFRLIYSLNTQGSGFKAPVLKDFNILSGPQQSQSTSMQMYNGQINKTVEFTYTYILQATREGSFTIPAANINVDGKNHQSNSLTIKVSAGSAPPPQQQQQNPAAQGGEITSKDLFIKAVASKSSPYQGEQVIVTYKLYTRVPVAEYSVTRTPTTAGFWLEDLNKDSKKLNQYRETIGGQEYVVAEIKKDAMFAQRSGKLTIEPLEMDVLAQIQRKATRKTFNDPFFDSFFNDSFLGSTYQNIKKTIRSNEISINVRPLPVQSRPGNFTGGVGEFNVNASIDRTELKTNEALTLRFSISGKGNIKLVEKPEIIFPTDFEVYDPRTTDNITSSPNGIAGTRSFEYLIIPRNPGKFKIKPISFSYFDLSSQSYKTVTTQGFELTVAKGSGGPNDGVISSNKEDIKYIGSDIRFIKTGKITLEPVDEYLFGNLTFLFWLIAVPIFFLAFLIIWRKELAKRSNIVFMKNKKATGIARKRLKLAERYLKQGKHEDFWAETSNALWGYMSDKFNIPRATLSMDSVNDALMAKGVKELLIASFIDVLHNCEFARFAPGNKEQAMDKVYRQAIEVITQTEEELK